MRQRTRSLRGQLILIPTMMLLAGLLGTVGMILLEAQNRIASETTSGMELGHDLAKNALRNIANEKDVAAAFGRLSNNLPLVRHVEFELVPRDAGPRQSNADVPRSWLARMLAPPPAEQDFPVIVQGQNVGMLHLIANPSDEIEEIVGEIELFATILGVLGLLLIGSLLWSVQRSLRSLQVLADGIDRLEQGDYRPMAPIQLTELRRIARQFDHLAQSLRRVTADNHFLIGKLLSVQEEERKALAADLHDEFGPVLFGIRAEAACIMASVPAATELHARAHCITTLAEGMQKVNYQILDRLRPLVLEQIGLTRALQEQVNTWRDKYPHIKWMLDIPASFEDPAEAASLTLFRAAQESAMNAVRHARASAIQIRLTSQPTTENLILSVRDDGVGLPRDFRRGFGLLGLTERVRQVGGTLSVRGVNPGVAVEATLPHQEHQTMEPAYADSAN